MGNNPFYNFFYLPKLISQTKELYIYIYIYIFTHTKSLMRGVKFIQVLFTSLNQVKPSISAFGLINIRAIIIVQAQLDY
jgi:hypothetical protein